MAMSGGDPVNATDPWGLDSITITGTGGFSFSAGYTGIGSGVPGGITLNLNSLNFTPVLDFNNLQGLTTPFKPKPDVDSIVVTALRDGGFKGLPPFIFNAGVEQLFYGYLDGIVNANVVQKEGNCNGVPTLFNTALTKLDSSRNLSFMVHVHQNLASGSASRPRGSAYPGGGDGFIPAKFGITSYQISSADIFAIRPDSQSGVGTIDHIFGDSRFPASAEANLRSNAMNAMNQKNSGGKMQPCR
jgi:hypothetical protein